MALGQKTYQLYPNQTAINNTILTWSGDVFETTVIHADAKFVKGSLDAFGTPDDPSPCLPSASSVLLEVALAATVFVFWHFGYSARVKLMSASASKPRQARAPLVLEQRLRTLVQKAPLTKGPIKHEQVDLREFSDPARLRDPAWLIPKIAQLCYGQDPRSIQVYRSALHAGLDLQAVTVEDSCHLIATLVVCALNMGLINDAMNLMRKDRLRVIKPNGSCWSELCATAIKTCAAKHWFHQGLEIHDLFAGDPSSFASDNSMWSCLLFCAIEDRAHHRCDEIFQQIKATGMPSQKDYWNMIRMGAAVGDCDKLFKIMAEMQMQGLEVDSIMYNTILATCAAKGHMDQAHTLLEKMDKVGGVTDAITYNTLMKGYAKRGDLSYCFELFDTMRKRGFQPSQVTYGILLDACMDTGRLDLAAEVFELMTTEGCAMNTVICTTLIKGFARKGEVDGAMRIYRQMRVDNVAPDLITFSILLKANCEAGRIGAAMHLLEAMAKLGIRPDEVLFNSLLAGCEKQAKAELAKNIYSEMLSSGVKPSTATYSIMIRIFAKCKLLEEAVELLRTELVGGQVDIEPRLFMQLLQSCIRARQGWRAIEVYQMMVKRTRPDAATHGTILGMCAKLNMIETGVKFLAIIASKGGPVQAADADMILGGALRKRNAAWVDSCKASMKALGMVPYPNLAEDGL